MLKDNSGAVEFICSRALSYYTPKNIPILTRSAAFCEKNAPPEPAKRRYWRWHRYWNV